MKDWRTWRPTRGLLSNALIVIRAALLLYVGWAYFSMWHNQRTLARQWHQNHDQPAIAGQPSRVNDGVVPVLIAKAAVDASAVDGVTRRVSAISQGHIAETPM